MGEASGNEERLLTAEEASNILGWHVQTVYTKAREGTIPSIKLGGSRRFKRSALLAWIEEQTTSPEAA